MHKRFYSFSFMLAAGLLFIAAGCRKTEDLTDQVNKIDFIGDRNQLDGPIDEWLYDHITVPYNIMVQYKWDRSEVDLSKSITPVDESKVIPVAEKIIKFYLEPYQAEAGDYFIKKYPPKQYMFIGSAQYNTNGSETVGSADAGRKIMLYRLNQIDDNNWAGVQRMLKTVHHEFAHILDHNRAMSPDFGAITKSDYLDDTWPDYSEQEAHDLGFVTPYSRSNKGEDFAEMVSVLLVYGQAYFDDLVNNAATTGQVNLRKKEQMVVDYFKTNWNIDFRSLQKRIQDLMPPPPPPQLPPFLEKFGDGLQYVDVKIDELNVSDAFRPTWDAIMNEMVTEANRYIAYFKVSLLPGGDQMLIRVYRYPEGQGQSGSASYSRLYFNITSNSNGSVKFEYTASGEDGNSSSSSLKTNSDKLIEFIEGNDFVWDWLGTDLTQGGLYVADQNGEKTGVAFTGLLE